MNKTDFSQYLAFKGMITTLEKAGFEVFEVSNYLVVQDEHHGVQIHSFEELMGFIKYLDYVEKKNV